MSSGRAIAGRYTIPHDCKIIPEGGLGHHLHRVELVWSDENRWITVFDFYGEENMQVGQTRDAVFIPLTERMIDLIPDGITKLSVYYGPSFVGFLEIQEIVPKPDKWPL